MIDFESTHAVLVFTKFCSITHIEGYKSLYHFIPNNSY